MTGLKIGPRRILALDRPVNQGIFRIFDQGHPFLWGETVDELVGVECRIAGQGQDPARLRVEDDDRPFLPRRGVPRLSPGCRSPKSKSASACRTGSIRSSSSAFSAQAVDDLDDLSVCARDPRFISAFDAGPADHVPQPAVLEIRPQLVRGQFLHVAEDVGGKGCRRDRTVSGRFR